MKTMLDLSKVIDWSTKDRPTIGKEYYFGETLWDLQTNVERKNKGKLIADREFDFRLSYKTDFEWANFLYPVEN